MIRPNDLSLLLTGFMATLSGIGLARFAYTALMPQMVQAGWFSGEQAAYLGAANLLGYLVGALLAATLAERYNALRVLRYSWIAVTLSFAACVWLLPLGAVAWFFLWRCISGIAGAILLVLGTSVALSAAPVQRRAALGPLMFCGAGAGALLSATLIPALAQYSLGATWGALALVGAWAGRVGWKNSQQLTPLPVITPLAAPLAPLPAVWTLPVVLVVMAYMCDAFGFVPHTVFWVDYLARERALGAAYAATQWAFFGLGAIVGPLMAALCATRWGWWRTILAAYTFKTTAIALPLLWASLAGHALSSFLVGALSPGIASITSGYLMQLAGAQHHKMLWGYTTALFALMQAISGYFMAWRYASSGSYHTLFIYATSALLAGSCIVLFSRVHKPAA